MKKVLCKCAMILATSAALATPALSWEIISDGNAGFSGFNGTEMNGDAVGSGATGDGSSFVNTNANEGENFAESGTWQVLGTGGGGQDDELLTGELIQMGENHSDALTTEPDDSVAQVGNATVEGSGSLLGAANGDYSNVEGGLGGGALLSTYTNDNLGTSIESASAEQHVGGGIMATAYSGGTGNALATAQIGGGSSSESTTSD